jgi:crotonobetainyl-CoA:carnitine CoA-transferase CaiB-like acyl-CoA transferase
VPYQNFPVAGGSLIIIAVGNDAQFARFSEILGLGWLAQDDRFSTNAGRVEHRDALIPLLVARTETRDREELLAALEEAGVPAGPINNVAQVFADPQVIARGMKIDLPDIAAQGGMVPGVRTPIRFSDSTLVYDKPSPQLGADTGEIRAAIEAGKPAFRAKR